MELSNDNWYEICKHCKSEHHILSQVSKQLQQIVLRLVEPINDESQLKIACQKGYILDITKCDKQLDWEGDYKVMGQPLNCRSILRDWLQRDRTTEKWNKTTLSILRSG